ncbi:hypothetical protein EYC80_003291 [Monilinia laxa]|uniref:Uncharacterized protein n=1 Tax=Monilinia laxa TaxID=61186 RepID=A0A5N6KD89_MONLA|nr:hypothetical protein EYC80_003291 [Monilinia laxa]
MAFLGVLFQIRLSVHGRSFGMVEGRRTINQLDGRGDIFFLRHGDNIPFLALFNASFNSITPLLDNRAAISCCDFSISSNRSLDLHSRLQTVGLICIPT